MSFLTHFQISTEEKMSNNPYEELLELDLFPEPPNEELKCPICMCVMKDPQQLNVCHHMFCKNCITTHFMTSSRNNYCPVDKKAAQLSNVVPAPRAIANIISGLQAKCFHHNEGCPEIIRVENLKRHSDGCRYRSGGPRRSAPTPSSTPGNGIPINIFVRMADTSKTIMLSIKAEETVRTLKQRIQEKEGVDPNSLVVHFKSTTCQDNDKLSKYGVKNSDFFWISRRFVGGA